SPVATAGLRSPSERPPLTIGVLKCELLVAPGPDYRTRQVNLRRLVIDGCQALSLDSVERGSDVGDGDVNYWPADGRAAPAGVQHDLGVAQLEPVHAVV